MNARTERFFSFLRAEQLAEEEPSGPHPPVGAFPKPPERASLVRGFCLKHPPLAPGKARLAAGKPGPPIGGHTRQSGCELGASPKAPPFHSQSHTAHATLRGQHPGCPGLSWAGGRRSSRGADWLPSMWSPQKPPCGWWGTPGGHITLESSPSEVSRGPQKKL